MNILRKKLIFGTIIIIVLKICKNDDYYNDIKIIFKIIVIFIIFTNFQNNISNCSKNQFIMQKVDLKLILTSLLQKKTTIKNDFSGENLEKNIFKKKELNILNFFCYNFW